MISHKNLTKAAHCDWSELEKNFNDFSTFNLPKSQSNIDWSDSDEETCSKRWNHSGHISNLSPCKRDIPYQTDNDILDIQILDDDDEESLSPVISQSRITKRNQNKNDDLLPIFKSTLPTKKFCENSLSAMPDGMCHNKKVTLMGKFYTLDKNEFKRQLSCKKSSTNNEFKETNLQLPTAQLNSTSSMSNKCTKNYNSEVVETPHKIIDNRNKEISKSVLDNLAKGSNWLKNIQHKTPEKNCYTDDALQNVHQLDSTKKKLEKNGFASQFVRLLSYWKSDVMMHDHQMDTEKEKLRPTDSHEKNMNSTAYNKSTKTPIESSCSKNNKPQRHMEFEVAHTKMKIPLHSFVGRLISNSNQYPNINCEADDSNNSCSFVYLIYCGIYDKNDIFPFTVGSKVLVYSPWQELMMDCENIKLIFSSYYRITPILPKCLKLNNTFIENHIVKEEVNQDDEKTHISKEFVTVDNSEQPRKNNIITLGEALRLSNESINKSIYVTMRVIKIKIIRSNKSNIEFVNFLIFGQDPSGTFLLLRVRTDSSDLGEELLLKSYIGSTRTFGGLLNPKRITDSEMPSLFTLIKSLHRSYVDTVSNSESLFVLLSKQLKREEPTFVYVFHTSLKLLKENFIAIEENCIQMPHWSISKAVTEQNGQRGSISVDIVYFYNSIIYVTSRDATVPGLLHIYVTKNCTLPGWLLNGTINTSVVIEDVLALDGQVIADQYSVIPTVGNEFHIALHQLFSTLPKYDLSCSVNDICTIIGKICGLNEKTVHSWMESEECNNSEVVSNASDLHSCNKYHCGKTPFTKYFIEVYVECDQSDLDQRRISVKLYQNTIEKLLKHTLVGKKMNATDLRGVAIGPLVVVVGEVNCDRILLMELPN